MLKPLKKDLRVQKTLLSIHNALKELIVVYDYDKITVTMLCEKAMINKKTFYNYYSSLDDLFLEVQANLVEEVLDKISKYKIPEELDKLNEEFFRFLASKGDPCDRIMCYESYLKFGDTVLVKLISNLWMEYFENNNTDVFKQNLLLRFLNSIGINLYRQWVLDGKKMPLDKVIELSNKLLLGGINGFLDSN